MEEEKDDFIREFSSSYEENWLRFVKETFKGLASSEDADTYEVRMIEGMKVEMQIVFDILIRLPIRRELKSEYVYLKSKVV